MKYQLNLAVIPGQQTALEWPFPEPVALVEVEVPGEPTPAYKAFLDQEKALQYCRDAIQAGQSARLIRLAPGRWEWVA